MPAKDLNSESRVNVVLDEGIPCDDCKIWFHYICSNLLLYKLYIYEIFHRTKRCEICSNIDTGFSIKFAVLMAVSRAEATCQEQIKRINVNTRSLKNYVDHMGYNMFQRTNIAAQTDCMIVQQIWGMCIQLAHADDARRSTTMRYD